MTASPRSSFPIAVLSSIVVFCSAGPSMAQFYTHGSSGTLPYYAPHPYYQPLSPWRVAPSSSYAGSGGYSSGFFAPSMAAALPAFGFPPVANEFALSPRPEPHAHIFLKVPASAQVWFEGQKTAQSGTLRRFVSPPLDPGAAYVYTVRVRWQADGRPLNATRDITVRAGDWKTVDFTR